MKKVILTFLVSFIFCLSYGQQQVNDDETKINETIVNFLKWYKAVEYDYEKVAITPKPSYSIIRDIPINKKLKRQVIDKVGVEKYLDFNRKSGFLSDGYLNGLRKYFHAINKDLLKNPPISRNEIVKINGLDIDIQLQTFEPEEILENISSLKITKILVIYNKGLVGINFKENVDMIFQLTKTNNKWLIDYIGADNTNKNSIFSQ